MNKLFYTVLSGFIAFFSFSILGGNSSDLYGENAFGMITFSDEEYEWEVNPPNEASVCSLTCVFNYFMPERGRMRDFSNQGRKIAVATIGDRIFLRMAMFRNNPAFVWPETDTPPLRIQWIEGRIADGSVRIPKMPIFGKVQYNLKAYGPDYPLDSHDSDTGHPAYIYGQRDTISLYIAELGNKTDYSDPWIEQKGSWDHTEWKVNPVNEDLVAHYNPSTSLMWNANHSLVLKSNYLRSYHGLTMTNWADTTVISTHHVRDEFAVRDFIIGKISESEPEVLPAPIVYVLPSEEVEYSKYTGFYSIYISDLKISLDLITEDSHILNYDKIHTVIYRNGEEVDNLAAFEGFSPFRKYPKFLQYINYEQPGDIFEVECYYECEDGGRIYSPRVQAVDATGVDDINEEQPRSASMLDGRTFDLTGREVNPDRLSPGIYIRDGKKFIVSTSR